MKPTDERLIAASLLAARLEGCSCDPEFSIEEERPGLFRAHVFHDDWCPLLRSRAAKEN